MITFCTSESSVYYIAIKTRKQTYIAGDNLCINKLV